MFPGECHARRVHGGRDLQHRAGPHPEAARPDQRGQRLRRQQPRRRYVRRTLYSV